MRTHHHVTHIASCLLHHITQNDTKAERPTSTKAPGFKRSAPPINPAFPAAVPLSGAVPFSGAALEFPTVVVVVVTVVVSYDVVFVSLLAKKLCAFTSSMAAKNKSHSRSPGFRRPAPPINPACPPAVPFSGAVLEFPIVVVTVVVVTVVVVTVVVVTVVVVVFVVVSLLAKKPCALTSSTAATTKSKRAIIAFDMAGLS